MHLLHYNVRIFNDIRFNIKLQNLAGIKLHLLNISTMRLFHYNTNANTSLQDNTKTFVILSCKVLVSDRCHNIM